MAAPTTSDSKPVDDESDEEVFGDADRLNQQAKAKAKKEQKSESLYDPTKIEPKYAKAENSYLWELASLARHNHPTVCLWAETVLKGKAIDYAGDPLLDFGLANFLDRVSYKNPKS